MTSALFPLIDTEWVCAFGTLFYGLACSGEYVHCQLDCHWAVGVKPKHLMWCRTTAMTNVTSLPKVFFVLLSSNQLILLCSQ